MKLVVSKDFADVKFIHDNLYAFNCRKTGKPFRPEVCPDPSPDYTVVKVEDETGKCFGGAVFSPENGFCYVHFLWLDDSLRGSGFGSRVIAEVKRLAEEASFPEIKLFTCSFQAPGFYPKLGFLLEKTTESESGVNYHYRLPLGRNA